MVRPLQLGAQSLGRFNSVVENHNDNDVERQ